jgi:preprotein translocase subunit SecE
MVAKQTASTPSGDDRLARRGRTSRSAARPAAEPAARSRVSLVSFFQESRSELRKVTWPSRQEATNLTLAVVVMTVSIAAFLGLMDQILNILVKPIVGG